MFLSAQNVEIDVTVNVGVVGPDQSVWFGVALRADSTPGWVSNTVGANSVLPYNGYVLRLDSRQIAEAPSVLRKVVNGTSTTLFEFVSTFGPSGTWRIKLQANGSTVRFKEWAAAGSEPASWVSVSDDQFPDAGTLRVGLGGPGINDTSAQGNIEALTVTDLDTSATLFTADFTGANGAPWPDDFAVSKSADTVMSIQTNQGRIQLNAPSRHGRAVLNSQAPPPPLVPPGDLAVQQVPAVMLTWDDTGGLLFDVRKNGTTIIATGLDGSPYHDTNVSVGDTPEYEVRQDGSDWSVPAQVTVLSGGGGNRFVRRAGVWV